jgi:hypothetical protein
MPRYFFSLENGHQITAPEGDELADDDAARAEARLIASDLGRNCGDIGSLHIVVRRADRSIVEDVPLQRGP